MVFFCFSEKGIPRVGPAEGVSSTYMDIDLDSVHLRYLRDFLFIGSACHDKIEIRIFCFCPFCIAPEQQSYAVDKGIDLVQYLKDIGMFFNERDFPVLFCNNEILDRDLAGLDPEDPGFSPQ
jgi:hypothetical protein